MTRIAIAGCGIIGAILAYELSRSAQNRGCEIVVLDRQPPARGATGAALGLTIGALSLKKPKSRAWKLRRDSLHRFDALIDELTAATGRAIPYNRNGILKLCTTWKPTREKWETVADWRRADDFDLELLDLETIGDRFPEPNLEGIVGGVHSHSDRQVEPVPLLKAAIEAAEANGVTFDFDAKIVSGTRVSERLTQLTIERASGSTELLPIDATIVTAGSGSAAITNALSYQQENLAIASVLGQALHMQPSTPLDPAMPVITCDDIHIVPRTNGTLWVGATVEFPDGDRDPTPDPDGLDRLRAAATDFYPAIAEAEVLSSWQGMRPRPVDRSAPVIAPLAGTRNALLATAHYRNGVLLAPATAQMAIDWLDESVWGTA